MDEGRFVFLTDSRSKKCRELVSALLRPRTGLNSLKGLPNRARVSRPLSKRGINKLFFCCFFYKILRLQAENPKAVVTFLWTFVDRSGLRIAREVSPSRIVFNNNNKKSAMVSTWTRDHAHGVLVLQVRVGGAVQPQAPSAYEDLYWSLIPNRRIRAYICEQGARADWDALKQRHDQLLVEVAAGKRLPMPAHL